MCNLAKEFAQYVEQSDNFEIVAPIVLGLVCFRLKVSVKITITGCNLNRLNFAHFSPRTKRTRNY